MNESVFAPPASGQTVAVPRGDRWAICRRLQELGIPSDCPTDGSLLVEVNHAIALVLVRSVVRQLLNSRADALDWLERCWDTQVSCSLDG